MVLYMNIWNRLRIYDVHNLSCKKHVLSKIYQEFYHCIICIVIEGRHIKIKKIFCMLVPYSWLFEMYWYRILLDDGCLVDSQGNFLLNSNYRLVICLHVLIMNNIIILQTKFWEEVTFRHLSHIILV